MQAPPWCSNDGALIQRLFGIASRHRCVVTPTTDALETIASATTADAMQRSRQGNRVGHVTPEQRAHQVFREIATADLASLGRLLADLTHAFPSLSIV
jgi:hypothetical protein